MTVYTKIPRKLKKYLKKIKLASHSESYKKYVKMKSKNIRISYFDKTRGAFGTNLKE